VEREAIGELHGQRPGAQNPLEATVRLDSTCAADPSKVKLDVCRSEVNFDPWTSEGSNAYMHYVVFASEFFCCDLVRFVRQLSHE